MLAPCREKPVTELGTRREQFVNARVGTLAAACWTRIDARLTIEPLRRGLTAWTCEGTASDQLITLTEGVIPHEERGPREPSARAAVTATGPSARSSRSTRPPPRSAPGSSGRCVAGRAAHRARRAPRARLRPARALRRARLGPPLHRPRLPARDARGRRHSAGRLRPVPWLVSSHGWAAWLETDGAGAEFDLTGDTVSISARTAAGPFRLHLFGHPTPAARLRAFVAEHGFAPVLPSGPTATGRAATSTSTRTTSSTTGAATATTTCRSTRSSSTPPGRRSTTPGASTPTSSRTPPGWSARCATTGSARSSG